MNKKAFEMSISVIILLVLGILVLIGLISLLVMGWDDFKTNIGVILGSDIARAQKSCNIQCSLDNSYDYCCEAKEIGDEVLRCSDEILKIKDCEINCSLVIC
jgi:hypothetical protein